MNAGTKLGVTLAATALAGTALGLGATASGEEPPPAYEQETQAQPYQQAQAQSQQAQAQAQSQQAQAQSQQHAPNQQAKVYTPAPTDERMAEGRGGGIKVGPAGEAMANARITARVARAEYCTGKVVVSQLNVRTGPGVGYKKVGDLKRNYKVTTDWDTLKRNDGYLWTKIVKGKFKGKWIADYSNIHHKWYVAYDKCK